MSFGSEGIEVLTVQLLAPRLAPFLALRRQSKACTGTPSDNGVTQHK